MTSIPELKNPWSIIEDSSYRKLWDFAMMSCFGIQTKPYSTASMLFVPQQVKAKQKLALYTG